MPGDDADNLRRMVWDWLGEENPVRPVGVASVIRQLPGAIRIHREKAAAVGVGNVGVFPAQVEDSPVVHHARAPVVLLVEAKLTPRIVRRVEEKDIGDFGTAAKAGHGDHRRRGRVYDFTAGKIAGVIVVDVVVVANIGDDLPQAGTVCLQFEDLPYLFLVGHRQEHAVGVEMQIHVADELCFGGFEYAGRLRVLFPVLKRGDLIVPAGTGNVRRAHVVHGEPQTSLYRLNGTHKAFYQQYLVEIKDWVAQQYLTLKAINLLIVGDGVGALRGEILFQGSDPGGQRLNLGLKSRQIRKRAGMLLRQIHQRPPQGLRVHQVKLHLAELERIRERVKLGYLAEDGFAVWCLRQFPGLL